MSLRKKLSFSYDFKKVGKKNMMPNRPVQKFSVKWKKGREIMVENENWTLLFEFKNVAEIEFKTC